MALNQNETELGRNTMIGRHWTKGASVLLVASSLCIAAQNLPTTKPPKTAPVYLQVPFEFPSASVGPHPILKSIVIKQGTQENLGGRAILGALQALQFSIIGPKKLTSDVLLPKIVYTTDKVPIEEIIIDGHNRQFPTMVLPTDRYYAISYEVQFSTPGKALFVRLVPIVYYKGVLSKDWMAVGLPYSGDYFAETALTAIRDEFARLASGN